MSNVIPFRRRPRTEFDCPKCGCCSCIVNVGRVHWGICRLCMVRWRIGENLFSGWIYESPETWRENERELAAYREAHA